MNYSHARIALQDVGQLLPAVRSQPDLFRISDAHGFLIYLHQVALVSALTGPDTVSGAGRREHSFQPWGCVCACSSVRHDFGKTPKMEDLTESPIPSVGFFLAPGAVTGFTLLL